VKAIIITLATIYNASYNTALTFGEFGELDVSIALGAQ